METILAGMCMKSRTFRTNGRVFGVGEFKYANKNFRGAKKVAIATKYTPKGQKMHRFQFCMICYLNFSGSKERNGYKIGKNKPKLYKFHFCVK